MISDYVEAPWRLTQMRATCVGPYIDDFSVTLAEAGYSSFTIRGYLRAADHVGRWADRRRIALASWDDDILARFKRHLSRCKCIKTNKGVFGDAVTGVRLLLAHLRSRGAIAAAPPPVPSASKYAPISDRFADWMLRHRGVVPRTNDRYQQALQPFIEKLGEDPRRYTVVAIRGYVIKRLDDVGRGETRDAVTALRAFLRFLVAEGRVPSGIQHCVPTVPQTCALPRPRSSRPSTRSCRPDFGEADSKPQTSCSRRCGRLGRGHDYAEQVRPPSPRTGAPSAAQLRITPGSA